MHKIITFGRKKNNDHPYDRKEEEKLSEESPFGVGFSEESHSVNLDNYELLTPKDKLLNNQINFNDKEKQIENYESVEKHDLPKGRDIQKLKGQY